MRYKKAWIYITIELWLQVNPTTTAGTRIVAPSSPPPVSGMTTPAPTGMASSVKNNVSRTGNLSNMLLKEWHQPELGLFCLLSCYLECSPFISLYGCFPWFFNWVKCVPMITFKYTVSAKCQTYQTCCFKNVIYKELKLFFNCYWEFCVYRVSIWLFSMVPWFNCVPMTII